MTIINDTTEEEYRKYAKEIAQTRDRHIDIHFLKTAPEDIHKQLRHVTWLQIMSLLETADITNLPRDIK